jgi:RNA polymerase sigma factor (sigma-70 family)
VGTHVVTQESLDDETDGGLMRRFALERDEWAFAKLVDRRGALVAGVCARMMRSHEDAEDAFQAVFLVLARRANAVRRYASLAGWLHNVAVRVCLNERRGQRRRQRKLQEALKLAQEQESARSAELVELKHVMDEELAALPARLREVLILSDLEGRTQSEAASALALPVGTVSSRLAQGRKAMRKRLLRQGFSFAGAGLAAALASCSQAAPTITGELVRATAKNAHIFLFGSVAAKAALSTKITSLAEGVLYAMILSRWKLAVCLVLVLVASLLGGTSASNFVPGPSGTAFAATIFFDDFEDGSPTDGNPVAWDTNLQRFPFTTFDVLEGNLRVSSSRADTVAAIGVRDLVSVGNQSIRAQVRLESSHSEQNAALFVRGNEYDFRSYHLEIQPDGRIHYGISGSDLNVVTNLRPTEEDVILQLDAIGNSITGWAWRAGEPKPSTPTFRFVDDRLAAGFPGLYFVPNTLVPGDPIGSAIYRYVHVADTPIPEPSGTILATAGGAVLASGILFGRRRLWRANTFART